RQPPPFVDVFKDTFIPDAPQLLRQVNNRSEDIQNVTRAIMLDPRIFGTCSHNIPMVPATTTE
ncbi:hypothetical protein HAX54_010372, partial [Datura stramonium]|nr:hypothetical protein [Datura stramonium]